MTALNSLIVNEVLRVQDPDARRLGLDRLDEDALILAFARWAEGQQNCPIQDDPETGLDSNTR